MPLIVGSGWVSVGCHIVLGKQVVMIGHGLELQIIPRRVLEEHSILLSRLAGESKMRLNDELDTVSSQSFRQVVKLLHRQC